MAAVCSRRRREVALHVQERRAGDVPLEVEPAARAGIGEIPAAVDEAVLHAASVTLTRRGGVHEA
jgi:hypothetical protein